MPPMQPLGRPIRLVVLISGGGTTLLNLVDQIRAGTLSAEIPLVISSRATVAGVSRAAAAGLTCEVITRKSFPDIASFSQAIFDRCREVQADLVICGGFLALIEIPADFQYRVMNIHPSLIPSFSGQGFHGHHVHEAVLARGCRVSGCTVHFVDDEYDHGPIISQATVPVHDDDTPDALAARVFEQECQLLPEAIQLFAQGQLRIRGQRVDRAQVNDPN
ncbi:phosphoribosylglycinamide formyltransferase [bacterium]|nr:phosphoribosylglycinamide formyltransferase [bacterium]